MRSMGAVKGPSVLGFTTIGWLGSGNPLRGLIWPWDGMGVEANSDELVGGAR